MIEVVHTHFESRLPEAYWQRHLSKIPQVMQKEIRRFKRWQDRQAKALGRLLLVEALKRFGWGCEVLDHLSYNAFGRPFLNDRIDFNISHSGDRVVCVATDTARVGIDIEAIRSIDLSDFKGFLTAEEWSVIKRADRPRDKFFDYWTIKESTLKAYGKGLSVPLNEIHICANRSRLYNQTWFISRIPIAIDYRCCVATDEENAKMIVRNVTF
jgi:4'-phosphopantetheinyl transferase